MGQDSVDGMIDGLDIDVEQAFAGLESVVLSRKAFIGTYGRIPAPSQGVCLSLCTSSLRY